MTTTTDRLANELSRAYSEINSLKLALHLFATMPQPPPPPHISLRELDILTLLSRGYTRKEAARELELAEDTIKTHMHRLRSRWHARNTTHLVALASAYGLLPRTQ